MTAGPGTGPGAGKPGGLGGLWLLLAPLACCGVPLLIGALAAAGALAWAGFGLAAAAVITAAALLAARDGASRQGSADAPGRGLNGARAGSRPPRLPWSA